MVGSANSFLPRREEVLEATYALLQAYLQVLAARPDRGYDQELSRALDTYPLPTALFTHDDAVIANASWRALFARGPLPQTLRDAIDEARRSTQLTRLATLEVPLPSNVFTFSVTLESVSLGVLVTCTDTTDSMLANEVGARADDLMWSGGRDGAPTYYSERWRLAIGSPLLDAIDPEDIARWRLALDTVAEPLTTELQLRIHRLDGTVRSHRVRIGIGRDNRIIGWATEVQRDRACEAERLALVVSEREAQQEADRANQLKDQFLAAVSHELRTPMTTLLLWERVLREASDDASRTRALDAIHHSVTTQARLVADLLDVARGISGKLYVDMRAVDVVPLVQAACDSARPFADTKSIALALEVGRMNGAMQGDETRLRQILDNLLSNAIKFTDRGGKVSVSIARRKDLISITVEDSGRGISRADLTRIFEPFAQVDETLTRSEGGLGLGLTIARQLSDLHRGSLSASSPGTGKGARFTLKLPAIGRGRASTPPAGARGMPRLDGAWVLVIDDDERVCEALSVLLQRAGGRVHTAISAAAGRNIIETKFVDAIVCDIAMAGEDGYSFVRRLRAEHCKLPVIAVTAYATELDARLAIDAGFDMHLAKPIRFERLVSSLSELLATPPT